MTTKCTGLMGRIFGHKLVNCYRIRYLFPHFYVKKGATKKALHTARDKWSGIDDCFAEWLECSRCGKTFAIRQYRMSGDKWTDYRQRFGAAIGDNE